MKRRFVLLIALAWFGCKSTERTPAAVLSRSSAPVERGSDGRSYARVELGSKLYLGDFVRTGAGTAELALRGGGTVAMEPNTTIVLRARGGQLRLEVGEGVAVLDGRGTYAVEMGHVRLVDGKVRLSAAGGRSSLELVLGHGVLISEGGEERALELGQAVLLEMGAVTLASPVDAAVPDAALAGSDAQANDDTIAIEVTGDGAKMQQAGSNAWVKLAPGPGRLGPRTRLTLDAASSATLAAPGATLLLGGDTRIAIAERFAIGIELGNVVTSVPAGTSAELGVPGGAVASITSTTDAAETRIDVDKRGDAHVSALAGGAKLTGKHAAATPLEIAAGGSAVLRATGRAEQSQTVIPAYFDHELSVGAIPSVTIHDPVGATAVRFGFGGKCPGTGVVEVDRDAGFRSPSITAGRDAANLLLRTGTWAYRLRCGGRGGAIASGRVVVIRDRGARPLPKDPPRYPIDADGRTYRVDYQSRIPDVQVRAKGAPGPAELHLVADGAEQVLKSANGTFAIPGTSLREREYTFYVVQNGSKSKTSTLRIGFDQTAAQVYIEAPVDGRPWGPDVEVRGATLPGWTAQIAGSEIPSDKNTRRFRATIAPPAEARAIAIQLSHPQRGVHLYLRRGTAPAR